jgi:spermidine synthase
VVCSQAGCPTLWRHDTLGRMVGRFDEVFGAVLPYCSDEHEWAYLTGRVDALPEGTDPVSLASTRLDRFPSLSSIDGQTLVRGAILPFALRAGS